MLTMPMQSEEFRTHRIAMDKHERLRHARIRAGFSSATSAANALGIPVSTYASHENDNRGFKADLAAKYARRFGVSVNWLLFGTGEIDAKPGTPAYGPADTLGELGMDEVEDEDLFLEAYREAKDIERHHIGGSGPILKFSRMVHIIYQEKLAERKGG
ncbi:DNA-binding XRE family transcriptional regulator [Labrenzia sp. EL_142]|nr:DNA-binding XRE family transcriptional regulator [Labrenzia sp. EL_142]